MRMDINLRVGHIALLLGGASALSLLIGSAAFAQDAQMETVIVTGVRASLQSAQTIKQNADTVVDSITATDIGALPDKSVAEALKRVPGVTVSMFASPSDSAHFSAEPGSVLIRGLTQVRSEFNGRDVFSADSSRGLSFSDVSPELMAGVDAYKNQTADLIEGGLAGSVNLRTRLPFDAEGRLISATAKANYGTLAHKITPDFSGIYSDRFDTKIGEIGVMLNAAYSMVKTASDAAQDGRFFQFTNSAYVTSTTPSGKVWIPYGGDLMADIYTRERIGGSAAVQYQNPSRTLLVTAQYNISNYRNAFTEHRTIMSAPGATNTDGQMQPVPSTGPQLPLGGENDWMMPATGTSFSFDKNGVFQSGILTGKGGWSNNLWIFSQWGGSPTSWTDSSGGTHYYFNDCLDWMAGWACPAVNREQTTVSNESRYNSNIRDTQDLSLNVKYDPTDRLHFNVDGQWVHSSVSGFDMTANIKTHELLQLTLTGAGPQWTDKGIGSGYGIDLQPGGWTKLANYYPEFAMDHIEQDKGNEFALRADAAYDFHTKWFDSVKLGVRMADRNQSVNWSAYNWQATCAAWFTCAGNHELAPTFGSKYFDTYSYGSDFMGGVFPSTALPFITINTMVNKAAAAAMLSQASTGETNWVPICSRASEAANSCFAPGEMLKVDERTWAGYAMLKFGGPDVTFFNDSVSVSGNIGVRIIHTTITSSGSVKYPDPYTPSTTPVYDSHGNLLPDPYNLISAADKAFSDGSSTLEATKHDYTHVLPSLNLKFALPNDWVARVAVSRAMSRPDMGLLRSYASLGHTYDSPTATTTVINPTYTASTGNPGLKPMYADMFDVSFERYFASVGSFSIDFFYKQFHDYFQYAHYYRNFTHNNVTRTALVYGPVNGKGGQIQGFELGYTRYFDFLPAPFNGLGLQANFVALHNKGISSSGLSDTIPGTAPSGFTGLPLEGLSDLSGNLIAMYEKGPFAVRIAYDWRSKYMVTAADCCAITDIYQRPYGQVDGSVNYRFGDHWEASIQGSNILGARVDLQQQASGSPTLLLPRSYFETDRRVELAVRMKY